MNAELTNALTNGMHATCLCLYFVAATRAMQRGDGKFTAMVVGFFFLTFVLKIMGVLVHYAPDWELVDELWVGIALGVILLNYLILHALRFPPLYRLGGLLFSVGCTALVAMSGRFNFIAVEIAVINLAAALYCGGRLRIGFLGVVASNLVWLAAREGGNALLGYEVPIAWRYDNDLYHLMLIVSTFVIYKGFARGDRLPGRAEAEASEKAEVA